MRAFGLRIPVVLAATAAVLAVLFFMQFVLQRQTVALPLATRLSEVSGVVGQPAVSTSGGVLDVTVRLGLVNDLQKTYKDLLQAAQSAPGNGSRVVLHVKDNPNPTLSADFVQLMGIVDTGRATGQYVSMQRQFTAEARTLGLTGSQLVLGTTHIYETLVQGSHYVYAILPLTTGAAATGGASTS